MAKAKRGSGIGASVKRKEDERHLHGRGRFVSDILLPNLHEVAFVRSPLAHARIRGIDVPEDIRGRVHTAESLEGVSPIRAVASLPGFKASDYPPSHDLAVQEAVLRASGVPAS